MEITDPEVCGLINWVRNIVSENQVNTSVHLTIRGPYRDSDPEIAKEDVDKWFSVLNKEAFFIGNIGLFNNEDEYVVYFKVGHPYLQKIWWKPDYPIREYGFNPHISLYTGKDRIFATELVRFLKNEKIELMCDQYRLITYTPKQNDLFQIQNTEKTHPLNLVNTKKVSITLFDRLSKFVQEQRKIQRELPLSHENLRSWH
ncbi:MAG: hypothetical protein ACREHG_03505 [Candidatus Saccharimonadales bacterium]